MVMTSILLFYGSHWTPATGKVHTVVWILGMAFCLLYYLLKALIWLHDKWQQWRTPDDNTHPDSL